MAKRAFLSPLLLLLVLAAPAGAADYWVKNGGNDGLDGLSPMTAWATLGHAADQVAPGDTVHVLDGDYQGFYLDRSGAPGQPITFVAEGAAVAITADNGTTPDGINLEGASHVVLDGFIVNDRTRAGIRAVLGSHVTVRNCRLGSNGRWAFLSGFVDDLIIEDNEAHHSVIEHGIYVSNSGDRPTIRRNHVHDNHANGIHMNGDASLGGDGTISNALVERNVIHGNGVGGGSGINMDGVSDSVVRNNLLYDNHASGISLYQIDGATGARNNLVINNTVVQASNGRWCLNINEGSTGNRVFNNVFYNLHPSRGAIVIDASSRPGFASDYNAVMNRLSPDGDATILDLDAWQDLGYDQHSFVATPAQLFVAPGSDFHLAPTSPAIDAGTATDAPPVDLEGHPRPIGLAVDVGAYELQALTCGDGTVDPQEQCGEPGLSCPDPCTGCSADCTCVLVPPTCGDGLVCGAEACEDDGDCGGGEVCQGCACVHPPVCASGIGFAKPSLSFRAAPFALTFRGETVIPEPWQAVNPLVHGVRVVIDGVVGGGGVDATLPGGPVVNTVGWKVNRAGTQWTWSDPAGTHDGVTKVVVQDRSAKVPGLVRVQVKGKGGSHPPPAPGDVRTTVVLGAPGECALLAWNGPGAARPRCDGSTARIRCR